MSRHNRRYKDSVFVDLFSEDEKAKENFLSLYNALHNTNLQLSCPVENIRLDNVMYMNIINDISCLVDNKIVVLAEHQSTINENMPSAKGMSQKLVTFGTSPTSLKLSLYTAMT